MIKAVIFDYDDTLVQTMKSAWKGIKESGKRYYNLEITEEQIKKYWGRAYKEMLTGVFNNIDTFENLNTHYEDARKSFPMETYPGALRTINDLLEKFKIGIVTASGRKLVIDDLTKLEFPVDKFFYIQTSEDTEFHKPDPRVFDPTLNKLKSIGVDKNELAYVGDSVNDYFACRDAGIKFYGIAHGGTSTKEEFQKEGTEVIDKLADLINLLK